MPFGLLFYDFGVSGVIRNLVVIVQSQEKACKADQEVNAERTAGS